VAHELHHTSRIRTGPGYGKTLGEALVTEGLADHFASEAFPDTPPQPWDNALSKDQEAELWRKAQSILDVPGGYNHQAWFFGGGAAGLPRWTGYTLGYKIVLAYLGDDRSASSAAGVTAGTVIEHYVSRSTRRTSATINNELDRLAAAVRLDPSASSGSGQSDARQTRSGVGSGSSSPR
jgi:uncharacterized protein YjaZ